MAVEKVDNMVVTPDSHTVGKHTDVTRELFLPANEGHVKDGTSSYLDEYASVEGGANANEPNIYWTMKVPDDFVSFTSAKAIWSSSAAAGNMYWALLAYYAACGEGYDAHTDSPAIGVTATGGATIINCQEPANPLTLASLALGDFIGLLFSRNGADANDTLDNPVDILGLLFTYVGHQ